MQNIIILLNVNNIYDTFKKVIKYYIIYPYVLNLQQVNHFIFLFKKCILYLYFIKMHFCQTKNLMEVLYFYDIINNILINNLFYIYILFFILSVKNNLFKEFYFK